MSIQVSLIFARPEGYFLKNLRLNPEATVETALKESQILEKYPDIDLNRHKVGIFGRMVNLNTALNEGDRVEIYRPLLADPKEIRRQRALKQQG